MHPLFMFAVGRLGVSDNRILTVDDPVTGARRTSLITPWDFEGGRYFISGSGESGWVRALRAAGKAQLKSGGRTEEIGAVELDEEEKLPVLRWYATFRIEAETEDDLRALAPEYPVFRIDG